MYFDQGHAWAVDDDEQDREDKASDQDFLRGVSGPSWNPCGHFEPVLRPPGVVLEPLWLLLELPCSGGANS